METEDHEHRIYNKIKSEALIKSIGKSSARIVFLENSNKKNNQDITVYSLKAMEHMLHPLIIDDKPYAVIDNFSGDMILSLNGKSFLKQENLTKNRILLFQKKKNIIIDADQLKKELKRLLSGSPSF